MLGRDFGETLRAARAGDEDAFGRLWRDANPAMIRYLRVTGEDDPYDAACEGWVTVLRGLPGFTGDETAWRVWLLACARMRAEEGSLRRAWSGLTAVPHLELDGDEIDLDDLADPQDPLDPQHRGLGDTIDAFRRLPLGQGEVLMLRLGAGLPVEAVADVVGTDPETVRRAEERGLERLATAAELLEWSLAAPPLPAELADESVAAAAFRSLPIRSPARSTGTRIVAVGERGRAGASDREKAQRKPTLRTAGRSDAPAVSGTTVIRASRGALLGTATICASAMTLGGLSAAAYVGALPRAIQQAAHDALGAPAPGSGAWGGRHSTPPNAGAQSSRGSGAAGSGTPGSDRGTTGPAALGLCRAWQQDQAKGQARTDGTVFRSLVVAAGGEAKVSGYCRTVLAGASGPWATSSTSGPGRGPATTGLSAPTVPGPISTTGGATGRTRDASPTAKPSHTKVGATTGTGTRAPRTTIPKPTRSGKASATSTSAPVSTGTATTVPSPTKRVPSRTPKASSPSAPGKTKP